MKKAKNESGKAQLKRQLLSMESQQKARERKDKEQEVVQKHKKQERELIKDGKQPFYLKKGKCFLFVVSSLYINLFTCRPLRAILIRATR